jgi:hypothetical protein
MLVDPMGEAVLGHIDHMNCRTRVKMDNLWECQVNAPTRCPDMVAYGPMKYCVHKDHVGFGAKAEQCVKGTLK